MCIQKHIIKKGRASENYFLCLQNLLLQLNISYTASFLANQVNNRFSNISTLIDILRTYNITSLATQISTDELAEIPYPSIIQIEKNSNIFFAVITNFKDKQVSYIDTEKGLTTISLSEFEKLWSGITLLIEKTENSAEPNYAENRKQENLHHYLHTFIFLSMLPILFLTT